MKVSEMRQSARPAGNWYDLLKDESVWKVNEHCLENEETVWKAVLHDYIVVTLYEQDHPHVYFDMERMMRQIKQPEDKRLINRMTVDISCQNFTEIVRREHPVGFTMPQLRVKNTRYHLQTAMRHCDTNFEGYDSFLQRLLYRHRHTLSKIPFVRNWV